MIHNPEVIPTDGTMFTMDGMLCPLCGEKATLYANHGGEGDVTVVGGSCRSDGSIHWAPLPLQISWTQPGNSALDDRVRWAINMFVQDEHKKWSSPMGQRRASHILSPEGRAERVREYGRLQGYDPYRWSDLTGIQYLGRRLLDFDSHKDEDDDDDSD